VPDHTAVGRPLVLVVEDERSIADLVRAVLMRDEYRVGARP